MKDTYRHEFNWWQRALQVLLGMWRINTDSIDFKWGYFAPRFGFEFKVHRGGYFDPRYAVSFCFVWGHFHVRLPFKTSLGEGCSMPDYGFAIHGNAFWIYTGGDFDTSIGQVTRGGFVAFDLPWFALICDGWEVLKPGGKWRLVGKKEHAFEVAEKEAIHETFDFKYRLPGGEIQEAKATCHMRRMKWHRKWFPFVRQVCTTLEVRFDRELGSRAGSWKGGVVGTGIDMHPGEGMEQALRRLEQTARFR